MREEKIKNFVRNVLPEEGAVLGENDKVVLRAISDQDYDHYIEISKEGSFMEKMYSNEDFCQEVWGDFKDINAAYYSVFDKETDEFVGYCAIKNLKKEKWELAIELLKKYRNQGYGYQALKIMLDRLSALTGEKTFRSRVDPENYASQALMEKLGARPAGLSEMLLHGETLEAFQKENVDLIDQKLQKVAEKFNVNPIQLLGCWLEYNIDWENK